MCEAELTGLTTTPNLRSDPAASTTAQEAHLGDVGSEEEHVPLHLLLGVGRLKAQEKNTLSTLGTPKTGPSAPQGHQDWALSTPGPPTTTAQPQASPHRALGENQALPEAPEAPPPQPLPVPPEAPPGAHPQP